MIFLCIPDILLADDLSVLAFPLIFWPMELVFCLLFVVVSIYCIRTIAGKRFGKRPLIAGMIIFAMSAATGILFPVLVSMNGAAHRVTGMVRITVIPVILLAVLAAVMSLIVAVRSWRKAGS